VDAPELRKARLRFVEVLGRELVRLEMKSHAEKLRAYYRTVRAGRVPAKGEWSEEHVNLLAALLRVAPHEADIPIKPRMWRGCCAMPRPITLATFPGGHCATCDGCKMRWLELDGS
jgi:hypothetical protein